MFVFGVHVASQAIFDRFCLPGIAAFGGRDATLITSDDLPAAKAYGDILKAAQDMSGVEGVVLLHENVEITDPQFITKITRALNDQPGLDIMGPTYPTGNSDTPDSHCLVLRPAALAHLQELHQASEGTDDFLESGLLATAMSLNLRIGTVPVDIHIHQPGDDTGAEATVPLVPGLTSFQSTALAWQGRAAHRITKSLLERWRDNPQSGTRSAHPAADDSAPPIAGGPTHESLTMGEAYSLQYSEVVNHIPADARRVLDISCGSGARGALIKERTGAWVTGLDAGQALVDAARTRLDEVWLIDLNAPDELPDTQPFDAIVVTGTIDRLVDPEQTLNRLVQLLHPNGTLIATVPNIKHWSIVLPLLLQDRFEYSPSGPIRPSSLRFFTMIEAAALLRRVGLEWVEAAAATSVGLAEPEQLNPLLQALSAYGVDSAEAKTLFDAYEFVITARRAFA